jgi:hypothetical protein
MATATAKKPKKRAKAKQVHIKEIEEERITDLDDAIDERAEIAEERAALNSKLQSANLKIGELMEENDLKSYRHGNYVAAYEEGEPELKIKKIKEPKEDAQNK